MPQGLETVSATDREIQARNCRLAAAVTWLARDVEILNVLVAEFRDVAIFDELGHGNWKDLVRFILKSAWRKLCKHPGRVECFDENSLPVLPGNALCLDEPPFR